MTKQSLSGFWLGAWMALLVVAGCSGPPVASDDNSGSEPQPEPPAAELPIEISPLFAPMFVEGAEWRHMIRTNENTDGGEMPTEEFREYELRCAIDTVWHDGTVAKDTVIARMQCEVPDQSLEIPDEQRKWGTLWIATPAGIWTEAGWYLDNPPNEWLADTLSGSEPMVRLPLVADQERKLTPSSDEWGHEVWRTPQAAQWCLETRMESVDGFWSENWSCFEDGVGPSDSRASWSVDGMQTEVVSTLIR